MNTVKPETVGFSSHRLARINTAMQRYVDEQKLAGIVTLVARCGQVVHFEKFGMANLETATPMALDTIFRIYSMTKPITTTAVLMLFEEGRLRLTDPVARYIPAFGQAKVLDNSTGSGVRTVDAVRPITVRDLLTHTAGLSYGFDDGVYIDELYRQHLWGPLEANPDVTLEDLVGAVAKLPLAFQPGTQFRYSFATDVLGYLVQVVAAMPFDAFLRQRILEPLGMVDTDFYVTPEKVGRFAAVYSQDEQGSLKVINSPDVNHYLWPTRRPSGGGGLVSTASDYLRFAQMLVSKGALGDVRLLGRKTVELMMTNHLADGLHLENPAEGFGLGGSLLMDLGKGQTLGSVGTFGWGGAANTNFWIDPQEELVGILMLQFMPSDTYPVVPDFRILTYQALVD